MIGTGTISSTSNSSIGINTPVSPGGSLRFSAGNNTVDSFSVNIGSNGSVSVASDLNIFGRLTLTSGHLNIENNTLIMGAAATIVGADANSYVITGTSGSLKIPIALATLMKTEFPIGTANAYFPASVLLNPGTPGGNIQIGVTPNVYINGTSGMDISNSQPVVDATWNVQSNIVSSLNLNLELMWSPSAEVNGFVRNTSFISHYTGASWDVSAILSASAGGNGLYSLTRMNLTSLSPFTVFDQSTSTGVDELMKPSDIVLYPNPVSENIMIKNIESSNSIVDVEVVNVYGQTVANYQLSGGDVIVPVGNLLSGTYFLKMKNDKMNFVKQFIKN